MSNLELSLKPTSLGWLSVVASSRGLRWVSLATSLDQALLHATRQFPEVQLPMAGTVKKRFSKPVVPMHLFEDWANAVARAIERPDKVWQAPLDVTGTPFQQAVWEALQAIPAGSVVTYGQLAARLGRPRAARAVGNACGANPIPFLVPCHRVVASNGKLGGFGLGLNVKRAMLEREGVRY